MTPVRIETAKTLAKDKETLDGLHMDKTSASYKMRLGMAKHMHSDIVQQLKKTTFSLSIDEATIGTNCRVLAALVSYYSPEVNQIVTQPLAANEITVVSSDSLFKELVSLFERDDLPWCNLMSVLMDSCNVMRGSKSGLETWLRNEKVPHLLDIDGDSCHHLHNATKYFCKPFGGIVEALLGDLFTDFKWSANHRAILNEMCLILGVSYVTPLRFVSHRWLSCYDVMVADLTMMDAFTVFYFAFLPKSEKFTYNGLP